VSHRQWIYNILNEASIATKQRKNVEGKIKTSGGSPYQRVRPRLTDLDAVE